MFETIECLNEKPNEILLAFGNIKRGPFEIGVFSIV